MKSTTERDQICKVSRATSALLPTLASEDFPAVVTDRQWASADAAEPADRQLAVAEAPEVAAASAPAVSLEVQVPAVRVPERVMLEEHPTM
jgi:hypothetical protein